ncbi:hypothetical protein [Amycolatopsis sp. NPDC098790]|uniref:hypothetical protein n=1 Tax=Amycolatopsis sp. NPDC098790 TaxID=3363939 RepID=UPI00381F5A1E
MAPAPPLTSLPGPRKYLGRIGAALDAGLNCLWIMPDHLVTQRIADDVFDYVVDRPDAITVPQADPVEATAQPIPLPSGTTGPAAPSWADDGFGDLDTSSVVVRALPVLEPAYSIVERLHFLDDGTTATDVLAAVVSSERLRGKVIALRGWEEPDATDVANTFVRFNALTKGRSSPAREHVRMLVAARQSDLPPNLLSRIDPMTAKVFWWWGSTTRLDTAVVVANAQPRVSGSATSGTQLHELVATEVAVEVAGPDLDVAAALSQRWDGRMSTLHKCLDEISFPVDGAEVVERRILSGLRQPPVELTGLWNAGAVDLWDGHVRITPAANNLSSGVIDMDTLIWRGQSRALTPLIDEQRHRFEDEIRRRIDPSLMDSLLFGETPDRRLPGGSGPSVLEIGQLAWLVHSGHATLPRGERELLNRLRSARNAVAHLRVLSDDELDGLARLLPG